MPTITRFAPAAIAASSSSPVPRVVATIGSRRSDGTSTSPEAAAISIAAVRPSPSRPNGATTGSPIGPLTVASRNEPPVAATRAATVPSPPSAIGTRSIVAPGEARTTPRTMASAARDADRLPLNLSGAITTRMAVTSDR